MDQPQVAFLDQVGKREPAIRVVLGDADDEPEVVLDQPLPRLEIASGHRPGERELLLGREQQVLADLVQIHLRDIVDDVGAEPRCGLGKRELLRVLIRLGPRQRRVVRRVVIGRCGMRRIVRVRVRNARELEVGVVVGSARRACHAGGR